MEPDDSRLRLRWRLVFEADSAMAMVMAHVQTVPVPPSRRTEIEIPESLERVILGCLEKEPARRPETGLGLLDLLAECRGVEPWTGREAERWWGTHMPQKSAGHAAFAARGGDETV